ncbi:BsuBI/PstI family type II restriction endonuclease [Azospirillum melinis]|uniref:BsuBI/PstI family type II restriction endonuclease n=1 Tax=Azospirillum melinis TaxID=328839 RepID=UPI0037568472
MNIIQTIQDLQGEYLEQASADHLKERGQYFTPAPVATYMAKLPKLPVGEIALIDAGAGLGILTAAFAERVLEERPDAVMHAVLYESDRNVLPFLTTNMECVAAEYHARGGSFTFVIRTVNFIDDRPDLRGDRFDVGIINPPYFKISKATSPYTGKTVDLYPGDPNIYASFMAVVGNALRPGGQLVAITPRSFSNGLYFKGFRRWLLQNFTVTRLHVFASRKDAFAESDVLQENIITVLTRSDEPYDSVLVSVSNGRGDLDHSDVHVCAKSLIVSGDDEQIIHIPEDEFDVEVLEFVASWQNTFTDLGYQISTGPVVTFRQRQYIDEALAASERVPLIQMHNVKPFQVLWTGEHRKDAQFGLLPGYQKYLTQNQNCIVLKRFSAKDEHRRLTAGLHKARDHNSFLIGFENHLNVITKRGGHFAEDEALGLTGLLNSHFIDRYFRCVSGNTQVNATEIRAMRLPDATTVAKIGATLRTLNSFDSDTVEEVVLKTIGFQQDNSRLDGVVHQPGDTMIADPQPELDLDLSALTTGDARTDKREQAKYLLKALGLPKQQTNDRSAWVLLALAQVTPNTPWSKATSIALRTVNIMKFIGDAYGKVYAPNSRETIRRQTLHQFEQASLVQMNLDNPLRPTNSGDNNYTLRDEIIDILHCFPDGDWRKKLTDFHKVAGKLKDAYERARSMNMVPIKLPDGRELVLSPGKHNELQAKIIHEFCPRYVRDGVLGYLGDTAEKDAIFDENVFRSLNISVNVHDKLPDVVVYDTARNWLFLIEAVTSHGPVSPKRHRELEESLSGCRAGRVYITAFLDRAEFRKHLADIAWETEVWVAEAPDHMVHFNGERFLGPYTNG